MPIFVGAPLDGGVMTVELSTRVCLIVDDMGGYFVGNVRDKASNITWRYATPCWPVINIVK